LTTFLAHLLLSIQTASPLFVIKGFSIDIEAVQEVFEKTLSNGEVASGWAVIIRTEMGPKKLPKILKALGMGQQEARVIEHSLKAAREVLSRAI
jgi:hypothetical protein